MSLSVRSYKGFLGIQNMMNDIELLNYTGKYKDSTSHRRFMSETTGVTDQNYCLNPMQDLCKPSSYRLHNYNQFLHVPTALLDDIIH